jgi:hypothetical protein
MSEAGKSKKPDRHAMGEGCMPHKLTPPHSVEYAAGGPPTDDLPPDDDGMGDEGGDGGDSEDPMLAKVFASKQWQELSGKIDELMAALTGEGGEDGMGGAPPGGPPMDAPGGDAPLPGGFDAPGGDAPMGAGMTPGPPGGPGNPGGDAGGLPMEEEAREFHGAPPVRFESTGMAGPGSTSTRAFAGGTKGNRYSRGNNGYKNGSSTMPTATRSRPTAAAGPNEEVIRMQRQINDLSYKLSRAAAEKELQTLKDEGILFGESPEEAAKNEQEELNMISSMDDQTRKFHLSRIRKLYKRRVDPANPAFPGAARYARQDTSNSGEGDEYEPTDAQDALIYAETVAANGGDRAKATKYMRSRKRS